MKTTAAPQHIDQLAAAIVDDGDYHLIFALIVDRVDIYGLAAYGLIGFRKIRI